MLSVYFNKQFICTLTRRQEEYFFWGGGAGDFPVLQTSRPVLGHTTYSYLMGTGESFSGVKGAGSRR